MVRKIEELCKKNNLSIASLEKELGFGNGTIRKWEKANPSISKVLSVAKRLNVPIGFLTGEIEHLNDDTQEIVKSISNLDSSQKGLVKCYISLITRGKVG